MILRPKYDQNTRVVHKYNDDGYEKMVIILLEMMCKVIKWLMSTFFLSARWELEMTLRFSDISSNTGSSLLAGNGSLTSRDSIASHYP